MRLYYLFGKVRAGFLLGLGTGALASALCAAACVAICRHYGVTLPVF